MKAQASHQNSSIPKRTLLDLQAYQEQGLRPSQFLITLLSGNLTQAFDAADYHNKYNLFNIIKYLNKNYPDNIWGTTTKVNRWIKNNNKS